VEAEGAALGRRVARREARRTGEHRPVEAVRAGLAPLQGEPRGRRRRGAEPQPGRERPGHRAARADWPVAALAVAPAAAAGPPQARRAPGAAAWRARVRRPAEVPVGAAMPVLPAALVPLPMS